MSRWVGAGVLLVGATCAVLSTRDSSSTARSSSSESDPAQPWATANDQLFPARQTRQNVATGPSQDLPRFVQYADDETEIAELRRQIEELRRSLASIIADKNGVGDPEERAASLREILEQLEKVNLRLAEVEQRVNRPVVPPPPDTEPVLPYIPPADQVTQRSPAPPTYTARVDYIDSSTTQYPTIPTTYAAPAPQPTTLATVGVPAAGGQVGTGLWGQPANFRDNQPLRNLLRYLVPLD